MATCANCSLDAVYEYRITAELKLDYCPSHLPKFLKGQRDAGLLKPTPVVVEAPVVGEEAVSTKTTKKKTSSVG